MKKDNNRDYPYQEGQLSLVGIHATILSILIAIVTAYSFHVQSVIQEMEIDVIHEAEKINYVPSFRYNYQPSGEFLLPKNKEDISKIFIRLMFLLSNNPESKELNIPKDSAARAEEAMKLINVIAHRYPFPTSLEKVDKGWSKQVPEPLVFGNIEEVTEWLEYLDSILKVSILFRHIPHIFLSNQYLGYFTALKVRDQNKFQQYHSSEMFRLMGLLDPETIFNDFTNLLIKSEEISLSTHYKINKLNAFRYSNYPKITIVAISICTFIVFLISVIYPILFRQAKKIFWIHVPCVYYISILIVILYEILFKL